MAEQKIESNAKAAMPFVFISHDTRDAEYAEAFSNLLKGVSAGVLKSFRSSDKKGKQGIEFGVEWYPEIIKNIQNATDVVCLLTTNSINRPWILFEAGMAKGKLDTPILGVALGVELKDASTGPFAQFQNCGDEEESLTTLMMQLVGRIPSAEPDRETIKFQVGKFKTTINGLLASRKDTKKGERTAEENPRSVGDLENSSVKLFEEIKIMFKDLPARLDRNGRGDGLRRKRRIHPMMIEELIHMSKNSSIAVRIGLSLYKDRFPWIYDCGLEILSRSSSAKSSNRSLMGEMEELLMMGTRLPFMSDSVENDDDFMLIKELPMSILKAFDRHIHEMKSANEKRL